jgi:hypothetical protein
MKRIAVPVAALALTVAALAGCSKNDTTSTTATTAAQASSGDKSSTTAGSETKTPASDKKGATTSVPKDGKSTPSITIPGDVTIPGNVSIPGGDLDKTLADAQKCLDMATAYAGLFTPLAGGQVSNADKAKIQSSLDEMKANVPDSIKDDIETIDSGIKDANSISDVSDFLSSEKFNTASENINTYLTTECNKIGK